MFGAQQMKGALNLSQEKLDVRCCLIFILGWTGQVKEESPAVEIFSNYCVIKLH